MASFKALPYDDFVVVAEEEWQIYSEKREGLVKFFTRIGNYEWQCSLTNSRITLECKEVNEETVEKMHIEVIAYYRYWVETESLKYLHYKRINQSSERKVLTKGFSKQWYCGVSCAYKFILLTIRILKDRCQFPLFTTPNSVGTFSNDVKLQVGEQIYHVNKQLLGLLSPVFDRMFNGDYKESKQEEINLKKVMEGLANPKAFEDFLLTFYSPGQQIEVLPNSQNVADLLELARYYQVDLLKKKCERHLELCKEVDILERILLAKKFELKELQVKLVNCATLEESRRINLALLDAPEQ